VSDRIAKARARVEDNGDWEAVAYLYAAERDAFLSAFKVWRNATESRCRLLSSRESSDSMLFPDKAFIEEVERILEGSDG
jgi:hypothetical protein